MASSGPQTNCSRIPPVPVPPRFPTKWGQLDGGTIFNRQDVELDPCGSCCPSCRAAGGGPEAELRFLSPAGHKTTLVGTYGSVAGEQTETLMWAESLSGSLQGWSSLQGGSSTRQSRLSGKQGREPLGAH